LSHASLVRSPVPFSPVAQFRLHRALRLCSYLVRLWICSCTLLKHRLNGRIDLLRRLVSGCWTNPTEKPRAADSIAKRAADRDGVAGRAREPCSLKGRHSRRGVMVRASPKWTIPVVDHNATDPGPGSVLCRFLFRSRNVTRRGFAVNAARLHHSKQIGGLCSERWDRISPGLVLSSRPDFLGRIFWTTSQTSVAPTARPVHQGGRFGRPTSGKGPDCVKNADVGFCRRSRLLTKARLCSDRLHQTTNAQNADYPFHVVGQDV